MTEEKNTGLEIRVSRALDIAYNAPIIYSEGSYFTQHLPNEVEFLYIIIENKGTFRRTISAVEFYLWYSEESGYIEVPIYFRGKGIEGHKVNPGESFVLACLREHFVNAARYMYPEENALFCAGCEILDGRKTYSELLKLDLEYPISPLQDIELVDYYSVLKNEQQRLMEEIERIRNKYGTLREYGNLYQELGIHLKEEEGRKYWYWKEYAPDAVEMYYVSEKNNFAAKEENKFTSLGAGYWGIKIPHEELYHGLYYELHLKGKYLAGWQKRVPAFAYWVEQNKDNENIWCARFWDKEKYVFQHKQVSHKNPLIYEAHIGMAKSNVDHWSTTERGFGSYKYFSEYVLPRIKANGYNTVQLMGVVEHPLYKSFGYQVSSYYSVSHRYGTLEEFKLLIDKAHELGLMVLLDIVHSHACPNTQEGLTRYDTGAYYFLDQKQSQWGTSVFDYGKEATRRFLLSNCRYWQEEYKIDGFRFDAVGSMIFTDEGFGDDFSHVHACFYTSENTIRRNREGILYLGLVNTLIHEINPDACTIAEEFSGAPGITSPAFMGGLGFDFRFAMGLPDFWAKNIIESQALGKMWQECTNHRVYEHTISYVECHDQSINGEDAMIWRIIGKDMYDHMSFLTENWNVSRGIGLIKMMKFVTAFTADKGYMTFMGNEFGHPEWIDADVNPYRQWHLTENDLLHYKGLQAFDKSLLSFLTEEFFKRMPRCRLIHEEKKLFVFERGKYLFVMNFHELQASFVNPKVTPGKYREIFSSDESEFSGHGNLTTQSKIEHFTKAHTGVFEQDIDLYIPPLTALVLLRE